MAYVVMLGLAAVVAVAILAGLFWSSHKVHTQNRSPEKTKEISQPSADAPTPGESVIESRAQIENARKRTPPA